MYYSDIIRLSEIILFNLITVDLHQLENLYTKTCYQENGDAGQTKGPPEPPGAGDVLKQKIVRARLVLWLSVCLGGVLPDTIIVAVTLVVCQGKTDPGNGTSCIPWVKPALF